MYSFFKCIRIILLNGYERVKKSNISTSVPLMSYNPKISPSRKNIFYLPYTKVLYMINSQNNFRKYVIKCPFHFIKGMLQEYWKIDMFLETFRLLACAISNFDWSPYKDFWTLDLRTRQYFKIQKYLTIIL